MRTLLFIASAVAALSILSPLPAIAASFDCDQATSEVEHMICGDSGLSRLDEALAEAYRQALSAAAEPDALRSQQADWLRDHRDPCRHRHCLVTAYRQRVIWLDGLGGRAAANGLSQDSLVAFLQAELNLPEQAIGDQARISFAPIRSPGEAEARWIAFSVGWIQAGPHLGIVDVSGIQPRVVSWEPYDCVCESLGSLRAVRLVATEPDFLVVDYTPYTGTCVAFVPTDVLRVDEGGSFTRVWQGTTYEAGGPPAGAEIAEIAFTHLRHGDDRAILRSARQVGCDDSNCFCTEGTPIRDFVELFVWDREAERFRLAD